MQIFLFSHFGEAEAFGLTSTKNETFLQSFHPFWNWLRSFQVNHIQPLGDASEQSTEYTCVSQILAGNRLQMQIRLI